MTYMDHGARQRAEKWRQSKEADGLAQINAWIDSDLKEKLDQFVKTGGLRNRSEAVAIALNKLMEENRN